jgi:BioD-like phosphotransacetylase family protein
MPLNPGTRVILALLKEERQLKAKIANRKPVPPVMAERDKNTKSLTKLWFENRKR